MDNTLEMQQLVGVQCLAWASSSPEYFVSHWPSPPLMSTRTVPWWVHQTRSLSSVYLAPDADMA